MPKGEGRKKYDRDRMAIVCCVRLRKSEVKRLRDERMRLKPRPTWADVVYRGLGIKRGSGG